MVRRTWLDGRETRGKVLVCKHVALFCAEMRQRTLTNAYLRAVGSAVDCIAHKQDRIDTEQEVNVKTGPYILHLFSII